jgi:hypothetical protein
MAKMYDLVVKVGEYTDGQGHKKGRFQNIGAMMEGKDGGAPFLMLAKWFSPAGVTDFSGKGGESVLISCYEPKGADGQASQDKPAAAKPAARDLDDVIPF